MRSALLRVAKLRPFLGLAGLTVISMILMIGMGRIYDYDDGAWGTLVIALYFVFIEAPSTILGYPFELVFGRHLNGWIGLGGLLLIYVGLDRALGSWASQHGARTG